LMGDGKAAFELMGQWAPNVEAGYSVTKKGIGSSLVAAPFPAVAGGVGKLTDVVGGGNGFAVGKNAPDAAVDFLRFLTNKENNMAYAALPTAPIIPTVIGAEVALKDPNSKLVKAIVDKSGFYQFYLDQFFSPAVGGAINDAVQTILAGTATPAQACQAIQNAYDANK
jgi:raffinose/stachyose/melibiose transport system substrate-binding protein